MSTKTKDISYFIDKMISGKMTTKDRKEYNKLLEQELEQDMFVDV